MNENTSGALTTAVEKLPVAEAASAMRPATIAEMKSQIKLIQECLRSLMVKETHYGQVPGCGDKPVLLKPGAELILALFHIAADPKIEEFSDGFDTRFRIVSSGIHTPSGKIIGFGVGEASTSEKKYKWRAAVCHEEWEDTPEERRQIAYVRNYKTKQVERIEQVRQNPADIINTVLKMARKRSIVDLCLSTTACSDIFAQDMDDPDINDAVDEGNKASGGQPQGGRYAQPRQSAPAPTFKQAVAQAAAETVARNLTKQETAPRATTQNAPVYNNGGGNISEAQVKRLYAIAKHESRNLNDEEISFIVWSIAGVQRADQISREAYNAVITGIEAAKHGSVLPAEDGSMF